MIALRLFCKTDRQSKDQAVCIIFAVPIARTQCTEQEKEAVFKYLSNSIREGRVPGKVDCEKCIFKAGNALKRRDWTAVKYYVNNQIDKRNRVLFAKSTNV